MLLCECLSVLAGHCVVWLSDSHSLKVWLFVSNLFATPALYYNVTFILITPAKTLFPNEDTF